jgi:acyl-CoA reductase-like NAD-dependent aldehyde dehydrogenase
VERVYVEAPVAEAFIGKVLEKTRALRTGDPATEDVEVGPLTMERQLRLVEEHVSDARDRGAKVLTGGARIPRPGFFYPPTVLTNVDHSMRVMRDEAVRLANDSDLGLTASAWTRSRDTARRLQRELSAGVVSVNDCVSSLGEPSAPYGGFKRSGFGRAHGVAGLREMAQTRYVTRDPSRRPMLWWYPYGAPYRTLMARAGVALHARSLLARVSNQAALMGSGRFWRRVSPLQLLRNLDRFF